VTRRLRKLGFRFYCHGNGLLFAGAKRAGRKEMIADGERA
jgi:hypothetical protein